MAQMSQQHERIKGQLVAIRKVIFVVSRFFVYEAYNLSEEEKWCDHCRTVAVMMIDL